MNERRDANAGGFALFRRRGQDDTSSDPIVYEEKESTALVRGIDEKVGVLPWHSLSMVTLYLMSIPLMF